MKERLLHEENPDDCFYEDRQKAVARLRSLVDEACRVLPTQTLGLASYHLCVYLDVATESMGARGDQMSEDLDAARKRRRLRVIHGQGKAPKAKR